jgi:hypothetical protein
MRALYANGRLGDAVWARYHIAGDVHDGIIEGADKTVLEMIEGYALGYRVGDPDIYAEALSFYANSTGDGHPEVLEIITRIGNKDVAMLQAPLQAERRAELLVDL